MQQPIRYLTTSDSVQLAWTASGSGSVLVKTANWLTHLQYDLVSPVWRHWTQFLSRNFHYVRYDERGCGMTQWQVEDVSVRHWIDDLETVVDAAAPQGPMALLGISQGAAIAIAYAVRHPERVSHLILYGGYSTGWSARGDAEGLRLYRLIIELVRYGWGSDNPSFRQIFTSRFIPGGSAEQIDWFNELCRRTTTGEIAAHLMQARAEVDVRDLLAKVTTPTLVLHATHDEITPVDEGHKLAAGIHGAEFVQLDSRNHVLLEHEPAWTHFKEAVLEFTGRGAEADGGDVRFAALSPRERDVLGALAAGRSNVEIGANLAISDKTVRNMLTRIFDKLGVRSRAQAIVLARDHGFGHEP